MLDLEARSAAPAREDGRPDLPRATAPDRALDASGKLDLDAVARLEAELVERGQWNELLALYDLAIERAPDEETGRNMMLRAGLLLGEKLKDTAGAETYLRRVLSTDPENLDAIDALRASCEAQGRIEEAASLLDAAIVVAAPEDKIDLCVELAELVHGGLDQPDRAVAALRYAYQIDPRRLDVLHRARAIYLAEGRLAEAKAVLDAEFEARNADRASLDAESERALAEAYRTIGIRLLETPLDHLLAEECLTRARQLGDNDALSRLDELAHLRRDWEAKVKALRDQAMEARDKRKAAELYVGAAELLLTFGKDPVKSDESLKRALILSPGYLPALRFIERSVRDPSRTSDVIGKLEVAATDVKDPATKAGILIRAARLRAMMEAETSSRSGSIDAYQKVLAVDPGHHEAAMALAGILEQTGEYSQQASVLEQHLEASADPHRRLELHLHLGRVFAELLGDSAKARLHFEAALKLQPGNFAAASALRALYTDAHEAKPLVGVLRALVEHAPDLESRLALLRDLSAVAAEVGKDEAFDALRRVFQLDPSAAQTEAELERLAVELKRTDALAESFAVASSRLSGAKAAALSAKAGKLYDQAGRAREAIDAYKRALQLQPDDGATRDALERLLRERNDPAALAEMIELQLSRNPAQEEQISLLSKLGTLLDRELNDVPRSSSVYARLLQLDPSNPAALASAEDLARRRGDFEERAALLERRQALAAEPKEKQELAARRAQVLSENLGKKSEAAEIYLTLAQEGADDEAVIGGLYTLASEGVERRRIATILEPVFAQRGQHARQVEMLRAIVEEEDDAAKIAELSRKTGKILEQRLQDFEGALDAFSQAVASAPGDSETLEAVLRLARDLERPERAAGLFSAILKDETLAPAAASMVGTALGALYDEQLDRKSDAIEAYRRALRADGSNAAAITALERLYGAEERWGELAQLIEEQLKNAQDPAARLALGVRLAAIREERLGDVEGAITVCRAVLARTPGDRAALSRLADLLEKKGDLPGMIQTLDQLRAASGDPDLEAAVDTRAAEVIRKQGGDLLDALERYQRVLARRPEHEPAIAGLEALLDHPEVGALAGSALVPIYEAKGRWRDLLAALEAELAGASDSRARAALYRKIAAVKLDHLGQAEEAFTVLAKAFEEGLLPAEERPALVRVGLAANQGADLAALLDTAARANPSDLELLRELAKLYDGPVLDPGKATEAWNRLLAIAPGDAEALLALERLHGAGDDPDALAEVLMKRAHAAESTDEQVALFKRASAIYEEAVEDLDRAAQAMEQARASAPRDRNTLVELQRLYEKLELLPKVVELRSIEAQIVEDPEEKADVLLKLASACAELGRDEEAVDTYRQILVIRPDRPAARAGLESLLDSAAGAKAALALEPYYRAQADWVRLVDVYERLAKDSPDPAERVERLLAIRSIYEERLGSLDRAFHAASRALKDAPASEEVLSALERLARAGRNHEELIGLYEDHADALAPRSPERVAIRTRLAKYLELLRMDRQQVLAAWRRVLEERPGDPAALEAIVRIATDMGDFDTVVSSLESLAEVLEEPAQKVEKLRTAARIIELQAGEPLKIIKLYERILTVIPGENEALGKLDGLYAQAGRHRDRERVLQEAISRSPEGPNQELLRLRLGRLLATKLGEPEVALEVLGAIVARRGAGSAQAQAGAIEALDALAEASKASQPLLAARAAELTEPYWLEQGNGLKVVAAKEARVAAIADPAERRRLLLQIAGIYEKDLDQPALGFLALARGFSEWPEDRELGTELDRLSHLADTREELADLYAEALPRLSDESWALALARRAAEIYDREVDRAESAVPFYERVLASQPDDLPVLAALEKIHRDTSNARGLVRVLSRRLELPSTLPSEKKTLSTEIARILESEIGDVDGAIAAHRARLAIDPDDRAALGAIAELAAREDRPEVLAEALERLVVLTDRPDDKSQLLVRLGTTRWDLGDQDGAVDAFSSALEARKNHPGAVAELQEVFRSGGPAKAKAGAALVPVLEETGAWAELVACLEAQLDATADRAQKKALLVKMADVYEERLGRMEHAFTACCRALREDLRDEALLARVERLAQENGLFEDLAAFYLDEIDQVMDRELVLGLRRRVADIYERELRDLERATTEHTKILELSPGDPETLRALERLYKNAGSFGSLAEVYRRRIAQADDNAVRVGLMRELARVQSEFLDDAPNAIATLRRVLDIEPNDLEALERLARLCAKEQRHSELADALELLISGLEQAEKPANGARLELAKLRYGKLDDRVGGDLLLREIMERDPKHQGAREYLRERIEDAVADDEPRAAIQAAEILASAFRATGEAQPLIEVLRIRVGIAADPESRVELNEEIASLYRRELKQPELAFTALTAAFRDAPHRPSLRAELESLAEELLLVEDLVDAYEASVERISDPEARLALEIRIAELLESKVGDRERALGAWEQVLRRRPMDPVALEALDRLNTALGRWGALTDVLEKRIELVEADDDAAYDLLIRLGTLWEERVDEKEEALACFRRARALKPREVRTLRALARLIDGRESPQELYAVLASLADRSADASELVQILPRMAELSSEQFANRDEAIDTWKKVLDLEPGHGKAIAELERLYEDTGHWEELAQHLEKQLKSTRDEREINRLQRKLATIRGVRLGSVDDAVKVWTQILRKNPSDVEALDALRKIYREAARWEDLVAILRKLIPLQVDSEGVKGIRFELAELFLQHLNRRDEAVESAKRVLDVEPHSVAQLMRLEEIFLAAGAFHDAVRVMTLRAELIADPGEKADVLFQIASIYETKMSRRAGAASAYERILQTEPSNKKAYEALGGIYEQAGDYKKLVDLKSRRLNHIDDIEERKQLLFEVIDIYDRRLGLKEAAFTAACRAFAEDADPRAQAVAERFAQETEVWEILAEVYEEQVDVLPLPRAVELRRRLAEVYLDKLDEPKRAERQLDLVISVRPDDDGPRAQMADLYQRQERWRELISLTLDRIELAQTVEDKKVHQRRIAEIEEDYLGELDAAIDSHKRVLELDPLDEGALDELIRLYPKVEGWRELVEALARKADRYEEQPVQRAALRFEIAKVWDEKVDDSSRAIDAYREVLTIDPSHRPALEALERLYTEGKRFEDLLEVYERQVRLAEQKADSIDFLTRISRLHDEEFADLGKAIDTMERLLELAPEHVPAIEELEGLLRRGSRWARLAELYQKHIDLTHDVDREVELYLALGEVQDQELNRRDLAEKSYQAALARNASSREAIHRLGELFERQGSWFNALEMLQREVRLIGSGPDAVELQYRIGRINEDMLMDRPAAKVALKRAIDLDAGYLPALRALAEIHRQEDRWEDVLVLEAQEAEHTENRQSRADKYQQAAETAIDHLDRVPDAIKYYEKSLEAVHDHIPSVRALSDLYFVNEEWERAERLLELLTSRLDRQDAKDELCRQYYRLAYISEKLDDDERALKRYLASYELDSTYLPTLEGLAAALLRTQRWEDAQRIFQTILVHHRESLTDAEVVDVYYQLGELAVKLGDHDRARRSFDRALDLDPNHPSTLRAYAALAEKLEEWEEAYDHRARLIDLLKEDDRFAALLLQAKLCRGAINDPYRSIDAYSEARKLRPDDEEVLAALGLLYRETSQHQRAIECYEDLLKVVPTAEQRRDVSLQLAEVHRSQDDWQRAVSALNSALDEDPMCVTAFEQIETILAEHGKWVPLEENYRRMIERLPKDNSQRMKRVVLWQTLGDLYRVKLKSHEGAKMAYEVVLKLKPDEHKTTATLAQLLSQKRETAPEALKLHHRLVPVVDDPSVPVRELFGLYEALQMRDRALCSLSALVLMRVANPVELKAYELLLKQAPQQPAKALDDKIWRNVVFHPDCRNSLADILSVLYRGAPDLFGEAQNALQLKKKEKVDLAQKGRSARAGLLYFSVWRQLTTAMQLPEMDHYHRPGTGQPPRLYPGNPMVLFAGEQHEIFREMPPKQIAWVLGRQLACARPELVPARALLPEDVVAAVEGAIRLFAPDGSGVNLGVDLRLVQNWTKALQRSLGERALKALRQPIVTCLERGEVKLLPKYLEGVEHTASRAALLMCNDVRVADRALGDPDAIVELSYRRRARELMLFTMSSDYFALRDHLGVSLQMEAAGAGRAR